MSIKNKIAKLGGLRAIALIFMLLQNVLIVRFLTLDEIGKYYLIVTVAYLGNAAIFVGSDLYLQRKLSEISQTLRINRLAFFRFIGVTSVVGASIVLLAATAYFLLNAWPSWWVPTITCAVLAVATYLSGLGRNICQLAAQPTYSNLGPVTEGGVRAIALVCLAHFDQADALTVATISAFGALIAAAVSLGLLLKILDHESKIVSYFESFRSISGSVISVGSSGVLNWAHLQGYRPILMAKPGGGQIVGSVAFLTTLGSTAANSFFTILAQLQVPKQYASQGASTLRYLKLLVVMAIGLSIACLPASYVFLWLSNKLELLGLIYLVAVGVLIEAGNAIVGVCTHHMNAKKQKMWGLPLASALGCGMTYMLLFNPFLQDMYANVAFALTAGQLLVVTFVLSMMYFNNSK